MRNNVDYIRRALRNNNLVPVVGAGFSAATACLPSWPGLLARGIDHAEARGLITPGSTELDDLRSLADSGDLPEGFARLQRLLSDDHREHYESIEYQGFLYEMFHDVTGEHTDLPRALRSLQPRFVLTTNYDLLLEHHEIAAGDASETWLRPASIRSILRTGSGVVHLHGRYDVPSSVVLSTADYTRLVTDTEASAVAQAAFHSGVLLFVGSSIDGMSDPHMGHLLEEFARITDLTRQEDAPHIALVNGRPSGVDVARLRSYGIEAVSYGDDHADLPDFLMGLSEPETITVSTQEVRALASSISGEESRSVALRYVAEFMKREVFPQRDVRISYAELRPLEDGGVRLETAHVVPPNSTKNPFTYPLSIAAWSLVEGRIIAWPDDADDRCDFDHLERLGKLADIDTMIRSRSITDSPEIRRYVDLPSVRQATETRTLRLGDFFQDWSSPQPRPRYTQFICVPVPIVESFGNRARLAEYGVFNIDALDGAPLLDVRTSELLKVASSLAALLYARPGPPA